LGFWGELNKASPLMVMELFLLDCFLRDCSTSASVLILHWVLSVFIGPVSITQEGKWEQTPVQFHQ
jgi:hypothetical protein